MTGQNPEVFHEELGTMKRVKAYIQVPEDMIPRYFKPRPLAYALQETVVRETEWQQATGTIVLLVGWKHSNMQRLQSCRK